MRDSRFVQMGRWKRRAVSQVKSKNEPEGERTRCGVIGEWVKREVRK